jgi:hypothetical protein
VVVEEDPEVWILGRVVSLARDDSAKFGPALVLRVRALEGEHTDEVLRGMANVPTAVTSKGFRWLQAIFGPNVQLATVDEIDLSSAEGKLVRFTIKTKTAASGETYDNVDEVASAE